VGAAGLAGHGAVAVLRHAAAAGRHHEGRGGGDVEQAPVVAAGTAGVHQVRGVHLHAHGQLAHDLGGGGDLLHRLALGAHAGEEAADLGGRGTAGHDLAHHRLHVPGRKVDVVYGAADGVLDVHGL